MANNFRKKDIEIIAEEFNYIKNVDLLEALNGSALIKNQNIKIVFDILRIKNKNIFKLLMVLKQKI